MLQHHFTQRKSLELYLAFAGIAVAAIVAVFVFQAYSVFGQASSYVIGNRNLKELSISNPEIINGSVTVDEATLNQAPKLKEIMNGAYERRNSTYGNSYTSQISVFDYDSIRIISERNPLGAERFKHEYGLVVKYEGLYYVINIIKR